MSDVLRLLLPDVVVLLSTGVTLVVNFSFLRAQMKTKVDAGGRKGEGQGQTSEEEEVEEEDDDEEAEVRGVRRASAGSGTSVACNM